jgi:benzoyl-CoA reductase/2-hydroxyglutaryl-CoA dehydratase subunit BcrC/BadD/HgdB
VIGWAIPDGPEELIMASGALPQALLGSDIPFSQADAHFQGFACSYTRSLLELLSRDEMNFYDAIILPHTCDALRAFDLVAKEIGKLKIVETYRPPRLRDNPVSENYLRAELERMRKRLGEITGHFASPDEIRQAEKTTNELKDALKEVKTQLKAGRASALEYFSAVQAGMSGDKLEMTKLVKEFLEELKARKPEKLSAKKVLLAGKVAEPLEILDAIEAAGFQVIDDMLVNGSRYIKSKAALEALAEQQFCKIPVAGMYDRDKTRAERILRKVKRSGAHAVIFLVQKFCEPYEMDVVGVEEDLRKASIPVLKLESDYQTSSIAPLKTRIDAFAEMLSAKK